MNKEQFDSQKRFTKKEMAALLGFSNHQGVDYYVKKGLVKPDGFTGANNYGAYFNKSTVKKTAKALKRELTFEDEKKPSSKKPASKKPASKRPKANMKKATKRPASKRASTKKPATKKAAASKRPVSRKPASKRPKANMKKATKKAATKRGARSAPAGKPLTKAALLSAIAEAIGFTKQEVSQVLEELANQISQSLGKRGPGVFNIPGLMKIKVIRKPATRARKGINPFTKEETMFKAKPARNVVKVVPLKGLKDMV